MQSALGAKALFQPCGRGNVRMDELANAWRLISGVGQKIAGNARFPISVKSRTTPCRCMWQWERNHQSAVMQTFHPSRLPLDARHPPAPPAQFFSASAIVIEHPRPQSVPTRRYLRGLLDYPNIWGTLHRSSLLQHGHIARIMSSLDVHV